MSSEYNRKKYNYRETELYDNVFQNSKYVIEGLFSDAFTILKERGAQVPSEFYQVEKRIYEKR